MELWFHVRLTASLSREGGRMSTSEKRKHSLKEGRAERRRTQDRTLIQKGEMRLRNSPYLG